MFTLRRLKVADHDYKRLFNFVNKTIFLYYRVGIILFPNVWQCLVNVTFPVC